MRLNLGASSRSEWGLSHVPPIWDQNSYLILWPSGSEKSLCNLHTQQVPKTSHPRPVRQLPLLRQLAWTRMADAICAYRARALRAGTLSPVAPDVGP